MIWLLDTNTVVLALNGETAVRERLNLATRTGRVVTSCVVLAELIYGAECSSRREANRAKVYEKLRQVEIIDFTRAIADRFGVLKAQLRGAGRLKADLDLMIATTAIEVGATLVTDDGDLLGGDIPGLVTENWAR